VVSASSGSTSTLSANGLIDNFAIILSFMIFEKD